MDAEALNRRAAPAVRQDPHIHFIAHSRAAPAAARTGCDTPGYRVRSPYWRFWREELEAMDPDRRPDAMMLEGACVTGDGRLPELQSG
jgi:hypothetical protein